jgi:hypothetical protein
MGKRKINKQPLDTIVAETKRLDRLIKAFNKLKVGIEKDGFSIKSIEFGGVMRRKKPKARVTVRNNKKTIRVDIDITDIFKQAAQEIIAERKAKRDAEKDN